MAIICTVLHICNTPPLPLKPALLLVYNITWIQKLFICDVLHSRYIEKEEKSKFKKKKKKRRETVKLQPVRVWGVTGTCLSSHAWCATCCLSYLLCRVYKGFFCFPCHIFLKPFFFIHCTPHWLPLLSSVLARFKRKFCFCFNFIFLISEGCCEHGRGGGRTRFFFFDRRSLQNLSFELAETYVHSVGATKTMAAAAARLCRRCRWFSSPLGGPPFHTALPHTLFLRQVTKQWGWRLFPTILCCFWSIKALSFFFFLFFK